MNIAIDEAYCFDQFRKHIESHVEVDDDEFRVISTCFSKEVFTAKQYVQVPGRFCVFEFFVIKGLLQHSIIKESGKEYTLSFPHENWWAGDFKSFKNELTTDKYLVTLEPTIVLKITRPDFLYLLENSIVFERYIARLSEKNSLRMQERVLSDMSFNLEEKVSSFYQSYPLLVSRLSQKRIASYLGISQEHLSKVLNKRKDSPTIDPS